MHSIRIVLPGILFAASALQAQPAPRPQQESALHAVSLQKFDRFWRINLFTSGTPRYSIVDRSDRGTITVELDLVADSLVSIPRQEGVLLTLVRHRDASKLEVQMPLPFRFETFYFAPGRKLVIDCYPREPLDGREDELFRTGLTLLRRGDSLSALQSFRKAIVAAPDHARAYLHAGLIRHALGSREQARADLEISAADSTTAARATALLDSLFEGHPVVTAMDSTAVQAKAEKVDKAGKEKEASPTSRKASTASARKAPEKIIVRRSKPPGTPLDLFLRRLQKSPSMLGAALALFFTILGTGILLLRKIKRGVRKDSNEALRLRIRRIARLMEQNELQRKNLQRSTETATARPTPADAPQPSRNATETGSRAPLRPVPGKPESLRVQSTVPPGPAARRASVLRKPQAAGSERFRASRTASIRQHAAAGENDASIDALAATKRRQIIALANQGKTVKQIAQELNIGVAEAELALGLVSDRKTSTRDAQKARFDIAATRR